MSCNCVIDRYFDVLMTVAGMAKVCAKNDFSFPKNGCAVASAAMKQ